MWYDLRVDGEVAGRLGLSELRQELANVLEGGAQHVEISPSGGLPAVEKAVKAKKGRAKKS